MRLFTPILILACLLLNGCARKNNSPPSPVGVYTMHDELDGAPIDFKLSIRPNGDAVMDIKDNGKTMPTQCFKWHAASNGFELTFSDGDTITLVGSNGCYVTHDKHGEPQGKPFTKIKDE